MSTKHIIPEETLKNKRLKKLMGTDYCTKPRLRQFLSRFEGVKPVAIMDGGRPVEWNGLKTDRERKICMVHFWRGFRYAEEYRELEAAVRRGEL